MGSLFVFFVTMELTGRLFGVHMWWPVRIPQLLIGSLFIVPSLFFRDLKSAVVYLGVFYSHLGALYLVSFYKMELLAHPIHPGDILLLDELASALGWPKLLALSTIGIVLVAIEIAGIWSLRLRFLFLVLPLALFAVVSLFFPRPAFMWAAAQFDLRSHGEGTSFRRLGALTQLAAETLRIRAEREHSLTREQVRQAVALAKYEPPATTAARLQRRNVYVILMESFVDVTELAKDVGGVLNRDALHGGFRDLWEAGGRSQMMSPEIGGDTANVEFEVLCGFPVFAGGVIFSTNLSNPAPCLPSVLAQLGYETTASVAVAGGFFNVSRAYRLVGFRRAFFENDFDFADMDGRWLSDASFFEQVLARIRRTNDAGKPVFNYIVSTAGHLPFALNQQRRPAIVKGVGLNSQLIDLANRVYYSSKELLGALEQLASEDPSSIRVVFGDHLPPLESGVTALEPGSRTADPKAWAMPLLFIDGRNGPVEIGTVAAYELMCIILERLGLECATTTTLDAEGRAIHLRPLGPGRLLLFDSSGKAVASCKANSPLVLCRQAFVWRKAVFGIARDLFIGRQYSLPPNGR